MATKGVIAALTLLVLVNRSFGFWPGFFNPCRTCDKKNCSPTPSRANCPYGVTKDVCGCCKKCFKGPGEKCGGYMSTYGICSTVLGLKCKKGPNTPIKSGFHFDLEGKCYSNKLPDCSGPPSWLDPVCGSDGKTYPNKYHVEYNNCKKGLKKGLQVTVNNKGVCKKVA